ncbi:hypothetical protein MGWOODY_Hyp470 [hydrothermal vent metagenome]|uniref:Uncharacterized protein n=1 Tax=hydrothermal vent metagenome TaxID=652676 RepID=A0A160U1C0_9ZZZZ
MLTRALRQIDEICHGVKMDVTSCFIKGNTLQSVYAILH